jgi:Tfp pilus assembly protein PilW
MPRMTARYAVITLLALIAGTAAASDWQPVYSNDDVSLTMDVASWCVTDQLCVRGSVSFTPSLRMVLMEPNSLRREAANYSTARIAVRP